MRIEFALLSSIGLLLFGLQATPAPTAIIQTVQAMSQAPPPMRHFTSPSDWEAATGHAAPTALFPGEVWGWEPVIDIQEGNVNVGKDLIPSNSTYPYFLVTWASNGTQEWVHVSRIRIKPGLL